MQTHIAPTSAPLYADAGSGRGDIPLWPSTRMGWASGHLGLVLVEKRLWYTAKEVSYFSFFRSL